MLRYLNDTSNQDPVSDKLTETSHSSPVTTSKHKNPNHQQCADQTDNLGCLRFDVEQNLRKRSLKQHNLKVNNFPRVATEIILQIFENL